MYPSEMSNVTTCRQHVDTFSETIIAKRISTYIHTDSYVRSRYGKLILCAVTAPCRRNPATVSHVADMSATCWQHLQLRRVVIGVMNSVGG